MLIQILVERPRMIGAILANTPPWVWGLLAGLLILGFSQVRTRTASLRRITITPIAMTAFSLWGTLSAFSGSPHFGEVLLAWFGAAAAMLALIAPLSPAAGTRYDGATRSFVLPGSWVPLALFLGIFLTKYGVGVELAMQPALARDSSYTLIAGSIYGAFSGIFVGRAARLWRLVSRSPAVSAPVLTPA